MLMINQWNVYASLYDQGIGKSGDTLHKTLIDPPIFEFLGDFAGQSILDAGCGNGYLLPKLAKRASRVVGVDGSKDLLMFAKLRLATYTNVSLQLMDLTKSWRLDSSSFDCVIANMLLQYLPDFTMFVSESARVLEKDGKLIVVIDHPGHALFLRAQELAGKKNDKFLTSASYFHSGLRKKKSLWDQATLAYYHRPLAEYFNAFTRLFHLDQMKELSEDGEMPRIAAFLWKKL